MFEMLAASPLTRAVGLALLHFLWQGAVIAGAAAWLFYCLRRASAASRYAAGCIALLTMALAPVATTLRAVDAPPTFDRTVDVRVSDRAGGGGPFITASAQTPAPTRADSSIAAMDGLSRVLPAVVLAWAAGVLVLTLNLTAAFARARRVKRNARPVADPWRRQMMTLVERIGLSRAIAFSESAAIDVPTLIGWMRPAILVPGSVLSGLTPSQLDAILTHELAHVRRHDYLVNVIQSAIETLLFYHPAVWWVSRRVRLERELCCDDVVVSVRADRVVYARALASLEEIRGRQPALGLAATGGGDLLARVRRILAPATVDASRSSAWSVLAAVVAVLPVVLFGGGVDSSTSNVAERPPLRAVANDSAALLDRPDPQIGGSAPGGSESTAARVSGVAAAAPGQVRPPAGVTKDQAAVLALEEQFRLAKVNNDVPALERLLDDAIVSTNQAGVRRNKTELLDLWRTFRVNLLTLDSADVRVEGDLATVTGRQTEISGTSDYPMLFTRIWRRTAGAWKLFSVTQFRDPSQAEGGIARTQPAAPPRMFRIEYELFRDDALLGRPVMTVVSGRPWSIQLPGEAAISATATSSGADAVEVTWLLPAPKGPTGMVLSGSNPAEVSWSSGSRTYRLRAWNRTSGQASGRQPVAIGMGINRPEKTKDVPPIYPAEAKAAGIGGMVIIETVIDENGDVSEARIIRSVPMLDQAALDAVRQWKYTPTFVNGQAVPVRTTVNITFSATPK
jgi:TonB family protein